MENMLSLQLGSKCYQQGAGILSQISEQLKSLGEQVFLVTDSFVLHKLGKALLDVLDRHRFNYSVYELAAYCTYPAFQEAVYQAKTLCHPVVLGFGGGRVMDCAKIVADKLGSAAVLVPTSAATCAAAARLSVVYDEEGKQLADYLPRSTPVLTLVDTDIVIKRCPVRYFRAGIVDALAKYPEIFYNRNRTNRLQSNILYDAALTLAQQTYQLLLEEGEYAAEQVKAGVSDRMVHEVLFAVISLTGVISCMASGGKQAALAHGVYTFLTHCGPQFLAQHLHGELVGAALPFQLAVNAVPAAEQHRLKSFLKKMSVPTSLIEIGVSFTAANCIPLIAFLQKQLTLSTEEAEQVHAMCGTLF